MQPAQHNAQTLTIKASDHWLVCDADILLHASAALPSAQLLPNQNAYRFTTHAFNRILCGNRFSVSQQCMLTFHSPASGCCLVLRGTLTLTKWRRVTSPALPLAERDLLLCAASDQVHQRLHHMLRVTG